MGLPNPTVTSYNGITFPVESKVTPKLTFVYDAARRTVVQTTVGLTVKARIAAGATQDASLDAIRAALERPGGQLVVTGLGLGTLAINTPTGKKDLAWGPIPKTLAFNNVGAGLAADIVWEVEVAVMGCLGAADSGQVMEFTWEATLATDTGGYTTRTINAELRIPMTRAAVGDPTLPDCADAYFEQYLPVRSPGYARTISRTVSRDKATLTFTVTDQELSGFPLPDGVVSATASHTYACEKAVAMIRWVGTLTASYEVARDKPRTVAWDAFKALIHDRIQRLRQLNWRFFPTSLSLGEPEIYGKQAGAFTLVYVMFRPNGNGAQVEQGVPAGGLWTPPPNATWEQHSASLANAQGARGLGQTRVSAAEDRIVDLCLGAAATGNVIVHGDLQPGQPADDQWNQIKGVLGIDDNPNPAATWLDYVCVPEMEERNRLATHFPLPTGPDPDGGTSVLRTPTFGGGVGPGAFPQTTDTFALAPQFSPAPVRQYGGSPGYFVRLVGRAVRFAYEIPRPVCPPIAGVQPFDANDPRLGTFWRSGLVGWTTHPIYAARWNLRYFVPRADGQASSLLPVMPNPFQQFPAPVR